MIDLTWKVFSQTGNIETYLLMKELENEPSNRISGQTEQEETTMDTKL
ncbi:YqzL family protein [Oceanobacillus kapialis]|uniref:YqzL family protein n=1 Tax=Oceanobacillus kapialis TaxID=481353 RepID=A0ABW5Q5R6_9BACI